MTSNVEILVRFLEESGRRDDVPGRLRKLVVCHVVKGNKIGEEIRAIAVPESPDDEWRAETARKISEQTAAEAQVLASGLQKYVVQALYQGDEKSRGRVIISVQADDADAGALDTEGPDAAGQVALSMRLTQYFAGAFGRSSVVQLQILERQVDKLTRENESLRAERLKTLKVMEEIYQAKHERDLETRREEAKTKGIEQTVDKLGLLIPMAINKMAGKPILPENAPERMIATAFAQRLTPDKLQRLAASGIFDDAELSAFLTVLQGFAGPMKADAPKAAAGDGQTNGVAT